MSRQAPRIVKQQPSRPRTACLLQVWLATQKLQTTPMVKLQAMRQTDTAAEDATGAQARCLRRTCVNYQAARLPVSSQISA